MDTNTKYRRWGWGAVIGLIAVILIAGLVVALTMNKKPKTDAEIASSDNGSLVVVDDGDENTHDSSANSSESGNSSSENGSSSSSENGSSSNSSSESNSSSNSGSSSSSSEDKNTHDSSANSGSNSSDTNNKEMPKTGPVDMTFAILGMAATAYLLGLNVELAKEKARK